MIYENTITPAIADLLCRMHPLKLVGIAKGWEQAFRAQDQKSSDNYRPGEREALSMGLSPMQIYAVNRLPCMSDLLWQGACAINHAAQVMRDQLPARFDYQSRFDREEAIRLIVAAMLAQALESDRDIL